MRDTVEIAQPPDIREKAYSRYLSDAHGHVGETLAASAS
jgi:hypothetical protein